MITREQLKDIAESMQDGRFHFLSAEDRISMQVSNCLRLDYSLHRIKKTLEDRLATETNADRKKICSYFINMLEEENKDVTICK